MPQRILFVGGGNMGAALIGGLIANGAPAAALSAVEIDAGQRERLAAKYGIKVLPAIADVTHAVDTIVPAAGDYAGRGFVNNRRLPAAINIGGNPTFGEAALKVEVHLVGWDGTPLYGQPLEVDFLTPLRSVRRFAGVDELKEQLARDVDAARAAFNEYELADKLADNPGKPT